MKVEPFDTQRQTAFSRRSALLSGGMLVLFGGVVYRLFDLQVRRYDEFAAKADDNRFKQRVVVPRRGDMLDRYGNVIATSRQNFRILLIPEDTDNIPESIARLEEIVPLSARQEERLLRDITAKKNQSFVPVEVMDNLSWDEFSAVNFRLPRLPGISTEVGETRFYPDGEHISAIVGHVGAADSRDLANAEDQAKRLLYLQPGFKLGKLGLEKKYDTELRGQAGTQTVEITAAGRVIDENDHRGNEALPGTTLSLTIDTDIQAKAYEVLSTDYGEYPEGTEGPGAISGAAVVMDVVNGDVIALVSTPGFNPNDFAKTVGSSKLRELETSPLHPMLCKPIAGAYAPGSTFKMLSAITAQEAGISPSTRFGCSGKFWYGGHEHNCWKQGGHGAVDMVNSLKHSCDVYYYNVATRVDIDHIAEVAKRFGLGQKFDLGLSGQVSGIVPSREWKRNFYRTNPDNQTWFPGETLSVVIGQGAVTSTPLQLAVMSARIATGKVVTPRIVRGIGDSFVEDPVFETLAGDPEHLDIARQGMDAVVNQWGTAARSSLMPDFRMAGKTGTSQVRSLQINPATGRPFQNHELPWRQRDNALFVAFAPYDNPRYACAVVVEHGGSGSKAAGPRARDLMRAVLEKDPSNPAKNPLYYPSGTGANRIAALEGQG
ncbi:penicillin-binding protein 2 [Parvularcula marina]|uniref:Penicillin-binding protein 2 n=1 Tax=Parvularcula marina TaxID=2292771 RepID=A0A371RKT4_9PROT|nr:penicillin-binding protein 2 [Parvularcula marina]RFB06067.1 penicillin-binding protein 2 [Parvularcula marina]